MSEIKTQPVKALHISEEEAFEDEYMQGKVPGSFQYDGEHFIYCCPCGCKSLGYLRVGIGHKPVQTESDRATWEWNGSYEKPTLSPSVNHVGHWHGWLKNGIWESC